MNAELAAKGGNSPSLKVSCNLSRTAVVILSIVGLIAIVVSLIARGNVIIGEVVRSFVREFESLGASADPVKSSWW